MAALAMAIERPEQMLGNFIADALAHAASPQRLEGSITRHSGAVPVAGHLSNSITSARPPWQRIRPGTKQRSKPSQRVVVEHGRECFVCSALSGRNRQLHILQICEKSCASWLSAHAGWLAICADWSLRGVGRFAWWRISGARPPGAQAFSRAHCLVRTSDAVLGDQRGER